jgi:two-component system OmpR family response regulator
MKVLLVEDDERISGALVEALNDQNYAVDVAYDGETGWDYLEVYEYSLILLDWMLPKLNGVQLCQRIRRKGLHTPLLLLTAKDTSSDKVIGLDSGADDYVVKPFDLQELMARVRALLRRGNTTLPPVLECRASLLCVEKR